MIPQENGHLTENIVVKDDMGVDPRVLPDPREAILTTSLVKGGPSLTYGGFSYIFLTQTNFLV